MSEFLELWSQLNEKLATLLEDFQPHLDRKDADLLRDFIENREYGVALEWLNSIISNRNIPISPNRDRLISDVATLMKIYPAFPSVRNQ